MCLFGAHFLRPPTPPPFTRAGPHARASACECRVACDLGERIRRCGRGATQGRREGESVHPAADGGGGGADGTVPRKPFRGDRSCVCAASGGSSLEAGDGAGEAHEGGRGFWHPGSGRGRGGNRRVERPRAAPKAKRTLFRPGTGGARFLGAGGGLQAVPNRRHIKGPQTPWGLESKDSTNKGARARWG